MIANLYMHPDTFIYNKVDTEEIVSAKLAALVEDMTKVVYEYNDENKFKVPTSFPCVLVFQGQTIIDMAEKCLSNDCKGVFYSMLSDTSEVYDVLSLDELRVMCKYREDEEEVNSILVFNVPKENLSEEEKASSDKDAKKLHKTIVTDYITFDNYEVVYNKQTWLNLRRQILGNHPETPKRFISECKKYFPNLIFHENCTTSLIDDEFNYLETSPRRIVYYLSCMSDNFQEFYKGYERKGEPNKLLACFSGLYGLDESGSMQQRPEKKSELTFRFKDKRHIPYDILCEPHLKISQEDKNCKIKNIDHDKFHPRIYFAFPQSEIEHGRIPIGSIGKHI